MSKKEIEKILSLQNKKVQTNVTVLSSDELGYNNVLRLDTNLMTRKSFIPRIAVTQADSEDRTLPRIVGSHYVQGCLIAIAGLVNQALNGYYHDPYNRSARTGFYIHDLEFEYCLKPNNKLVFDASESEELWLITYDKDTIEYKAKRVGEVFVKSISIAPAENDKNSECLIELYIHVAKETGLAFNKKVNIQQGYHTVRYYFHNRKLNSDKEIVIEPLSESEFTKAKKKQTSLESLVLENKSLICSEMFVNSKLKQW